MSQIIVLLGKPGSGKDTQAELLQSQLNYKLIKTGHFVRALSKKNTKIAQILEQGGLVDNDLVNNFVADVLAKNNFTGRIVTDGYPRDVVQARWLDDYLNAHDLIVNHVLLLNISDELARQRLKKRQRHDDEDEIINNRFDVFRQTTQQVINYYAKQAKLIEIDASRRPAEINKDIIEAINA